MRSIELIQELAIARLHNVRLEAFSVKDWVFNLVRCQSGRFTVFVRFLQQFVSLFRRRDRLFEKVAVERRKLWHVIELPFILPLLIA